MVVCTAPMTFTAWRRKHRSLICRRWWRSSPRERDVAAAVARGLDNNAIADLVGISLEMVKTHVGNSMNKLGARDHTQMAVTALLYGLNDQHDS